MDVKKYVRIFLNILIPVLMLYLVCFWGPKFLKFFLPFVIGWLIAMIANPLVRFMEKKIKIVRKHGSVVLIVGVLGLVIGALYFLITFGFRELSGFMREIPEIYEIARVEVVSAYESLTSLFNFVSPQIEDGISELMNNIGVYIGEFLQDFATRTGGAVARSIPDIFVNTIILLLSSYLFLAEHDKIIQTLKKYTPESILIYLGYVKRDLKKVIGGYFLAQFKIMFVVAIILLIGFLILKVRYSFLLALLIAMLDFLPMFGTGTALIPWALVKLFTGDLGYAIGLALIYVISQAVRQLVQPKIVGDSMGLPPLTTLFFLYLGYKVKGLAGMILAVPIGLIFINFYRYGAFDSLIANVKLLVKEIRELRKDPDAAQKTGS